MSAALGITTYNRPTFADKCFRSVRDAVRPLVSLVSVYNDGSDAKYRAEYRRAYGRLQDATIIDAQENHGVAFAKNRLLETMLEQTDADWLFLCEDDILVKSPEAITEYVRVAEETGIHHFSFAYHGEGNSAGPSISDGQVEYHFHSVGAWCMYSRESLEKVGLFDENFNNAWEHVEMEMRLIDAGFMPGSAAHRYPDVVGSSVWLKEIPNSIEKSSIRPRDDWESSILQGLRYWHDAKPETFSHLFGPGTHLENYANRILNY